MVTLIPGRRATAAAVTATVVAGLVAGLATATPSTADAVAHPAATRWMTTRSLCATPADPASFHCFAEAAVDVPRGTAGAVATPAAAIGHGPAGGYSPADLAKAYGYNRTAKVSQTVAVVDWYDDPYALADLNAFDRHYGFPVDTSMTFRKVNQRGSTTSMPKPSRSLAGEISLDVEAVRAVCAYCSILLVEADAPSDAALAAAENTAARLGADEISNSWGGAEIYDRSASLEKAFRHPGVVITASTGDDGWFGWDPVLTQQQDGDNSASFPSTFPLVVSVGGTRLTVNPDGTRKSEVVWNNDRGALSGTGGGATGGGCSLLYPAPAWQGHEAGYASTDCHGKRLAADISVLADPRYGLSVYNRYGDTSYNPRCHTATPDGYCWQRIGGTSLSSPVVAAMYALAGGSGGSAYPAASLYINSDRTPAARYDVTAGGNGYCGGDSIPNCSLAALADSDNRTNNPNGIVTDDDGNVYGDLLDCSYRLDGADQTPSHSNPECTAGPGLDGPSGLGTPRGLRLFADTSPGAILTAPVTVTHGLSRTYGVRLYPTTGAHITSVTWAWGDATSSTGRAATTSSARHTYRKPGRYRLTLGAHDSLGQTVYRSRTVTVR